MPLLLKTCSIVTSALKCHTCDLHGCFMLQQTKNSKKHGEFKSKIIHIFYKFLFQDQITWPAPDCMLQKFG